jgi:benzoate 4-monooxygenase
MALLDLLITPWAVLFLAIALAIYYLLPYFTTYGSLSRYPGPFSARFSNTWLALSAKHGQKFAAVDWAHRKYGKVVRVGFNHVSIADEKALQVVYGHGNGFLKE